MLRLAEAGGLPVNGDDNPTGLFVVGLSVRAVEEICIRPAIIDCNGDVQGARRQADYGAAARCGVCLRVVHESTECTKMQAFSRSADSTA
jgi:hypothetical protein